MPRTLNPPTPPPNLVAGVSVGDFWAVGEENVRIIEQFAHLRPAERVLDVGSGLGRVAWPLAQTLDGASTYHGFDAHELYVEWCREGLGLDPERFHFHHFDLYSSMYNPNGPLRAETFRFPWSDGAFTLTIATSLFTHLLADGVVNYLNETARTLESGGRMVASFFVLDEVSRKVIEDDPPYPEFRYHIEHGMLANEMSPDDGVAFDAEWLLEQFINAGYEIAVWQPGSWRRKEGPSYQDFVVARKK